MRSCTTGNPSHEILVMLVLRTELLCNCLLSMLSDTATSSGRLRSRDLQMLCDSEVQLYIQLLLT